MLFGLIRYLTDHKRARHGYIFAGADASIRENATSKGAAILVEILVNQLYGDHPVLIAIGGLHSFVKRQQNVFMVEIHHVKCKLH